MIAHKEEPPRAEDHRPPSRVASYRWGLPPAWKERTGRDRRERLMTSLEEERRMLQDRRLAGVG